MRNTQIVCRFCVEDLGVGFRLLPSILEHGPNSCSCTSLGVPYASLKGILEGGFYDLIRSYPQADITIALNPALVPIDIECHSLCSRAQSTLGIGHDGRVGLCHIFTEDDQFCFGNLQQDQIGDIWRTNPKLQKFRNLDPDHLKGVCGRCLARSVCRGGCRLHAISKYGDFFAPDPQCQVVYELGEFPEYALEEDHEQHRQ